MTSFNHAWQGDCRVIFPRFLLLSGADASTRGDRESENFKVSRCCWRGASGGLGRREVQAKLSRLKLLKKQSWSLRVRERGRGLGERYLLLTRKKIQQKKRVFSS